MHRYVVDLSEMSQVRTLAEDVRARHGPIDVLANNAGALFASRQLTGDGFERTFALNHLAPFLLTHLLRDRLVFHAGPLGPLLWPGLWLVWQWRGLRMRALAPSWRTPEAHPRHAG